jgi:hypothetical protein
MHYRPALTALALLCLAACTNVTGSFERMPNRSVEIWGKDGHYHARFYDTDVPAGLVDRITVDATVNGDEVAFVVPDGFDGSGEYRGRVSRDGFAGTWTHKSPAGAVVTEKVLWGRWVVVI